MKKAISVIVPVYNGEKYLEETINSILEQTFKDFELLIVNDGSTDLTASICDKLALKDNRICVFHQENKGVSAARNKGISLATGEYICFIDSDDYIESNMFEILYKNAIKFDVDISCCGVIQTTLNGIKNNSFCSDEKTLIDNKEILIKKFFTDPTYKEVLYGPYNKLIKTKLAKSIKFNENFKIGEDLLFNFECIENMASFYFENVGLYHYIKREGSATTSSFSTKRFDYVYVADILLEKCKNSYKDIYEDALYWNFMHKLNICRMLCKYSVIKKENIKFFNDCYLFCKANKKHLWKKLNFRKKIDYTILRFTPFLYKFFL